MKLELPRGMRDIQPSEHEEVEFVREKFIQIVKKFNFQLMDPSPIEMLSTLSAKGGPAIIADTYNFVDKGGRHIALRFDYTVGLSRYVSTRRDLKFPAKLASFGGVWRYDEPQMGRYRYFHQWDIEIFGSKNIEADIVVIELVALFLQSLGLDVIIEINHKGILEDFISNNLHIVDQNIKEELFRAVDKTSKKQSNEIMKEYNGKLNLHDLSRVIDFSKFNGYPAGLSDETVLKSDSWKQLTQIFYSLKERNVKNIRINFGIVRGLDYYSGMVFEARDTKLNIGSLVGGGRYDKLTEIFGRADVGAIGAAGGIERIVTAMKQNPTIMNKSNSVIYVVHSSGFRQEALNMVTFLRNNGFSVDYDINDRNLNKQIIDSAQKGASILIVINEHITNDEIILKYKNSERSIRVLDLVSEIKSILK